MKTSEEIIEMAANTIKAEGAAILKLIEYLTDDFSRSVFEIYNSKGRVIVTGIGKSAIIAQKIVATFNSTGTPAIFMHAADAVHGDLGNILKDDIVICISKSGNTPEIKVLVPLIKKGGNKLIAIVGNPDSLLARQADFILLSTVEKEACPNNLAPTTSTTAQLVIGDALAVCLLNYRGFSRDDFARFHPGGSLGKRLYMRVSDLYINNECPKVFPNTSIQNSILEISSKRLGATAVIDEDNKILGIITDGDLRRMLQNNQSTTNLCASDIMSKNPKTIEPEILAIEAFNIMTTNHITQLLVVQGNCYKGIIHLHDILREGIV